MHQWLCQSETVPSVYEACRDVSLRKDGRLDFMHILSNRVANMHCARWQDTYRAISYHPVALFAYLAHGSSDPRLPARDVYDIQGGAHTL